MRIVDIITKKRDSIELNKEEINFFIEGYTNKDIPDYQVSALLMAIYFNGMTDKETSILTKAMLNSGDKIDLSSIDGIKVDKHSTGGVGDKTSLVVGPLVAACGLKVAKLSGRGLGHTGGTLDKLESIEGVSINIDIKDFINQVNKIGISIAGQTSNLTPADKALYALRDVTATVPSIPLIASSIMSKKLASGADTIVLDVKVGNGAFMKDIVEARKLAITMKNIGTSFNKNVTCLLTNMDEPLGSAVGNKLEVLEAIDTLKGNGPDDFKKLCVKLSANILFASGAVKTEQEGIELSLRKLSDNSAYNKFIELIKAQGAISVNFDNFINVKNIIEIKSTKDGYINSIDTLSVGIAAMKLGAGRAIKSDTIDPNVGLTIHKKVGDFVKVGEVLAKMYVNSKGINESKNLLIKSFSISNNKSKKNKIVLDTI